MLYRYAAFKLARYEPDTVGHIPIYLALFTDELGRSFP